MTEHHKRTRKLCLPALQSTTAQVLSVAMRRGVNKAAVAVARKLVTAVWHILKGHWCQTLEENSTLLTKLARLATELGVPVLHELGYASKIAFQQEKLELLRTCP